MLTLEIVTPAACVYSETIETVVVPTTTGEIGILPGHLPLLTQVRAGELRVTKDGVEDYIIIGDGFAEIECDRVSILAENAINDEEIDTNAAEAAVKRAEAALKNRDSMTPEELDRVEAAMRFSMAQLAHKLMKK
ncbi:F-type H+-transporting ATPase subunit epsilon [Ereboglobus sp. PH5-5]|uniref:ATP synthase F1 subunit epsilon n=1 Tax=unclassified Ereboglobus TaxID=2626932 RepID=UPI0024061D78|nr:MULTISPECIES: ATP synthase F1 subunit epsilon [unclassified Ereboglobus]MDF9826211.1 F-type H+-transporting ATPase subunit epsilon [Ereboglobus sp. PH5-10]MDF9832229.1 F-type H+-transporting ATPase subunit epsilon [Ereboglobus sp. PH5-5]